MSNRVLLVRVSTSHKPTTLIRDASSADGIASSSTNSHDDTEEQVLPLATADIFQFFLARTLAQIVDSISNVTLPQKPVKISSDVDKFGRLARLGVFSRSLRVATNKKYFRTEFKKEFNKAERSRRLSFFLVSDESVKLFPFFCDKCRCSLTSILAENTVFHQFDCFVEWADLCNNPTVKGRLPMQIDKCNNQRGSLGGEYCARS